MARIDNTPENKYVQQEMLAEVLEVKLTDNVVLSPLTKIVEIEATAGDTIQVPQTAYIGDAKAVAAGEAIDLEHITQSMKDCKVGKIAKGIVFTEEDLNNAFFDINEQAEIQMLKALSEKVEKDLFAALRTGSLTATIPALNVDGLADALVPFGENINEEMYLFVNPVDLAALRKDDNFILNANHNAGAVASAGQIFGLNVVVTKRVDAKKPIILKNEAVALYIKKAVTIEQEKDIVKQVHNVVATQHYAVMLHDDTKVIQVTVEG